MQTDNYYPLQISVSEITCFNTGKLGLKVTVLAQEDMINAVMTENNF